MNKQQEPRLRFKGFTGAWECRKLREISIIKTGISNREDSDLFGEYTFFDRSQDIRKSNTYLYDCEAIIMAGEGSEFFPKHFVGKFDLHQRSYAIMNFQGCDGLFVFYYLHLMNDYFCNQAVGSTVKSLRLPMFTEMPILLPTKFEQTAIGNFFRRLDSQIAESRAVLEKSRQLKKAMLAKMFPANGEKIPKIRFKGFEGEWSEWKLGAFGKATSGTSLESEFCEDGNYKVISIGSYSEKSTYTDQGIRTHKNDLTMILNDKTSLGRIIGRVLLIDQNDTYVYNQRTQRIEIDQEHFIPLFLYYLLNAENIRQKIIYSAQGNTQIYVNWSGIKNLEYLIPPTKAEQTAIGNFFRQLDETIALQSAEVEKLNQLKKGLLAAMLV